MLPELDNLTALFVMFVFGAVVGVASSRPAARSFARFRRTQHFRRDTIRRPQWRVPARNPKMFDAADQLRVVMAAEFASRPLLNASEARVFTELDQMVSRCNPGWRVMAQVSLGEILSSQNAEAFSCINSKRVDMLIIDENCRPRHAIEYQGHAHYQGNAAARDAVKKEALRRAGIGYHEVIAGQTLPAELRAIVERLVPSATS